MMRARRLAGPALAAGALIALLAAERLRPLRAPTQPARRRMLRNAALGAMSMAVVSVLQRPLVEPLARRAQARRLGLAQRLPLPAPLRDAAAFLLLDYGMYVWHVATHRVPLLWRFHLVHHVDRDLDASTALRFHLVDMAISIPWRMAQVRIAGASPRALALWQSFFFASVLFHHSNLRLGARAERLLGRWIMTPRLHGIHHDEAPERHEANWSSGLVLWDRLHGTRVEAAPGGVTIGLARYRAPADRTIEAALRLPFAAPRAE
jgi:sterol desaturase/sphingolipid hydroxylase (fatty acid hydroxylase superfamily)